ncbi:MAG: HAMP domain-containing protein [Propionibacteriales bacterium]|nr:HAMP domain-containing protein [Propionibacteriales bacterium]
MAADTLRARFASVRVRTTLAAVLVVAIALAVGATALVLLLREALTDSVESAAETRTEQIVQALDAGSDELPGVIAEDDEEVVQVLDESGSIVAASPNIAGDPVLAGLGDGETTEIDAPIEEGAFVAVAAETDDGRLVVVAHSLEDATDSVSALIPLLLVGLPLLLAVVGGTTWYVVGRALAPVDRMRREVDEISAEQLYRRVEPPATRDEVGRLARTMNRMLDRLEEAQVRQRRFVSDASHELRSPLASIRQNAEVALAHPDTTTGPELAETVLAEGLRVQYLVEALLLLARADEHSLQLADHVVDLDDLVFTEAQRLRDTTDLQIDTTGVGAGRVRGDAPALTQVLCNLADNAARHASERVSLGLTVDDSAVVLTVDDDGAGIPETERDRVFERFVRLDESRARDDGGSGLGLSIVTEIVTAHRGTVCATEGPHGGARIVVRIPAG